MIRLWLPALCVCLFATQTWAQSSCCNNACAETCCNTTIRTDVSYSPVTTQKWEKYIDHCGRCRVRCVPCTTLRTVCQSVPATPCQQVARSCYPGLIAVSLANPPAVVVPQVVVDGVWGIPEQGTAKQGANFDRWATGPGGTPTAISDTDPASICFACGGFSPVSPGIHDATNARRLSDTD